MTNKTDVKIKSFFVVSNDKGLHTRPATELVKYASAFKSKILLTYQGVTVNAKSLLGILMLAAAKGAKIHVDIEGEDADEALSTLHGLAKNKFYIKY